MLVIASRGSQLALWQARWVAGELAARGHECRLEIIKTTGDKRSEEHTSELQSLRHLVCRLLLEKRKEHAAHRPRRATTPADRRASSPGPRADEHGELLGAARRLRRRQARVPWGISFFF